MIYGEARGLTLEQEADIFRRAQEARRSAQKTPKFVSIPDAAETHPWALEARPDKQSTDEGLVERVFGEEKFTKAQEYDAYALRTKVFGEEFTRSKTRKITVWGVEHSI